MSLFSKFKEKLSGVRRKWSSGITRLFGGSIGEDFWYDLEDLLIAGDVGLDTTERLLDEMRAYYKKNPCDGPELLKHFRSILVSRLQSVPLMGAPLQCGEKGLSVILMVGVNGSGKTTTTGKLAWLFKNAGKTVIVAAADTFRAAAVEQLQVWGERTGIRVVAQRQGSDSAAVVYDAISAAKSAHADVLIVDTAGRLQSKHNLMEELGKIYRIAEREVGRDHIDLDVTAAGGSEFGRFGLDAGDFDLTAATGRCGEGFACHISVYFDVAASAGRYLETVFSRDRAVDGAVSRAGELY